MKLRDEIDKLKKNHFVKVVALKAKIEQHKSENLSIQKELERTKKPKINLSVSNKYFCKQNNFFHVSKEQLMLLRQPIEIQYWFMFISIYLCGFILVFFFTITANGFYGIFGMCLYNHLECGL